MNLLAALFLLNTSFLLSEPLAAGTMEGCQAVAALLHGSLLCALGWMWAEGFHLYLLLIKVYNIYVRHYLLKLCLCTWGECPHGLPLPHCPCLALRGLSLAPRSAHAGRGGCSHLQEKNLWAPHHQHC